MRYSEHRPHPALFPFVECLWFASDEEATGVRPPERVLPDGCIEWIFHFGAPFRRWTADGRLETQPVSFVAGEMTRPLVLAPAGRVATMGVRFRPGGAYRFLPVPLEILTDTSAPTADLWGRDGRDLQDAILETRGAGPRRRVLNRFLLARLRRESHSRPRLDEAVRLVLRSRGQATVAGMSRRVGWSPRQLEREFRRGVGLSPKALARTLRFQNALRLAGRGPSRSWAGIAAECGYADQAHLIREFRALSGATPSERADEGELARNFVTPARLDELLRTGSDVAFVQDAARLRP